MCLDRKHAANTRLLGSGVNQVEVYDRPINLECVKETKYDCEFGTPPTRSALPMIGKWTQHRYDTHFEFNNNNQLTAAIAAKVPVEKPIAVSKRTWSAYFNTATEISQGKQEPLFDAHEFSLAKRAKKGPGFMQTLINDYGARIKKGLTAEWEAANTPRSFTDPITKETYTSTTNVEHLKALYMYLDQLAAQGTAAAAAATTNTAAMMAMNNINRR